MTRRSVMLVGLLLAVLGVTAAHLMARSDPRPAQRESPPRAIPVDVVELVPAAGLPVQRRFTGSVGHRRRSVLSFERTGRVVSLAVDDGQTVQAGETVAQQDIRRLQVQRKRLLAELAQAQAVLDELRAGPRLQTIAAARADVARIEAEISLQQLTVERQRRLLAASAATSQQVDDVVYRLRALELEKTARAEQLEELESGTRPERVRAQQGVVDALQAALEDLAIELEDSRLKAPYDGRIARRLVDSGTVVTAAQPVFELVDDRQLEVRVGLPVNLARSLTCSQAVDVVVDGRVMSCLVRECLPELDEQARTQEVILDVPAAETDGVVPGMFVELILEDVIAAAGFEVPATALASGRKGLWSVFVVVPGHDGASVVERRDVEVLHTDGVRALIRGSISSGDRVVASGTHRIVAGTHVTLRSGRGTEPGFLVTDEMPGEAK